MKTLVASFVTQTQLRDALPRVRALGVVETHTPQALEEGQPSILPLIVLIAGLAGAVAGFFMQVYASVIGTRSISAAAPGSRGPRSFPSPSRSASSRPCGRSRLFLTAAGCRPDRRLAGATRDRWCLTICTDAPDRAHALLRDLAADKVEELPP